MATLDLIKSLIDGDSEASVNTFNELMAERVQNRLETFRQETAKKLFSESAEVVDESTDTQE